MRKRIPILFLMTLLAGVLMGLATSGRAQDEDGRPERRVRVWVSGSASFLGVHLEEVTSQVVERLGLPEERGALLTKVVADSPAASAGLQKDDVVLSWNGVPVESAMQLRRQVHETPAGRTVRLGVFRDGHEVELVVKLASRSDFDATLRREVQEAVQEGLAGAGEALRSYGFEMHHPGRGRMGVMLQHLTPQLADYFGLKDRSGALIASVGKDSPAAQAGLKAGDVVIAIDGEKVDDPGDAIRIIAKRDEGPVEVRVLRDRQEKSFTVNLEKRKCSSLFLAPEIDIRLNPLQLPDMPYTFGVPRFDAPTVSPGHRFLHRFKTRRISPGVI